MGIGGKEQTAEIPGKSLEFLEGGKKKYRGQKS